MISFRCTVVKDFFNFWTDVFSAEMSYRENDHKDHHNENPDHHDDHHDDHHENPNHHDDRHDDHHDHPGHEGDHSDEWPMPDFGAASSLRFGLTGKNFLTAIHDVVF